MLPPAYLLPFELLSLAFSPALGLSVSDYPPQEIQRMLFVPDVGGAVEPVDGDGDGGEDDAGGHGEREICRVGEEGCSHSQPRVGDIELGVEGAVEVGGDAGVDVFIEIHFGLVHLTHLLLRLQQIEGQQLGLVVLGVGQSLDELKGTKKPLWMRWRR